MTRVLTIITILIAVFIYLFSPPSEPTQTTMFTNGPLTNTVGVLKNGVYVEVSPNELPFSTVECGTITMTDYTYTWRELNLDTNQWQTCVAK